MTFSVLKKNIIRAANNNDAEEVMRLVFKVLRDCGLEPDPETTDADLKDIVNWYHNKGGCFDVMENLQGKVIGTVGLYPLSDKMFELRKMYLHPEERGKGLGKALLEHSLRQASKLGFSSVILETASVLKEAISLYKNYGFKPYKAEHLSERCDQAYIKKISNSTIAE